jgi:hypothetical protein
MKMSVTNKDISLEWSFSQKCFHIEPVMYSMRSNMDSFLRGGASDYVLLGIFGSDEEASAAAQTLREQRPDMAKDFGI